VLPSCHVPFTFFSELFSLVYLGCVDYYQEQNYVTGWENEGKCHSDTQAYIIRIQGDSGGKSSTFNVTVPVTLRK
jgi:hypothetical protein